MRYIYEPRGRAGEYGKFALNLYSGCSHGCTYCYAPAVCHRSREDFHSNVAPRHFDWRILNHEIADIRGQELFLCFTCDPYPPFQLGSTVTRLVIEQCHKHDVKVIILTKGAARSERDFDLLEKRPDLSRYGVTLTFTDAERLRAYEPGADPLEARLSVLRRAKLRGIPTWVSFEPVIAPEQTLGLLSWAVCNEVDEVKIGKWNHDKAANDVDWIAFFNSAMSRVRDSRTRWYFKQDLIDAVEAQLKAREAAGR